MRIRRLTHVGISFPDIEHSLRCCRDVLGCEEVPGRLAG
jgi:hypothetical protein